MKKSIKNLFLTLFLLALLPACEKDEDEKITDHCLIIVQSRGDKYAIVSPSSDKVLHDIQPNIHAGTHLTQIHLGYRSEKVIFTAKEPGGTYVKLIYTCDRETAENITAITAVDQWDVQSLSASPAGPHLVFHGSPVAGGMGSSNLFKINIDGTGLEQLTLNREIIEGVELQWPYFPSWAPDGQRIAFRGGMKTPDPGGEWYGRSIILINLEDDDCKKILYNEPDVNSGYHRDISWTPDGRFLIFLTNEHYSTPKERVKVLNVEDMNIIDITYHLLVEGLHTTNLYTSPRENKILFNKFQPGGGDLHEIEYEITADGEFRIKNTYRVKMKVTDGGLQYGSPKWQLFP